MHEVTHPRMLIASWIDCLCAKAWCLSFLCPWPLTTMWTFVIYTNNDECLPLRPPREVQCCSSPLFLSSHQHLHLMDKEPGIQNTEVTFQGHTANTHQLGLATTQCGLRNLPSQPPYSTSLIPRGRLSFIHLRHQCTHDPWASELLSPSSQAVNSLVCLGTCHWASQIPGY